MSYSTLQEMVVAAAEIARPPRRISIPEAAEKYRKIKSAGAKIGDWSNDITPYIIEPMRELTRLDTEAVIFVGPAQSAKTEIILNWLTHTTICAPRDMMIVQTAKDTARDFAERRVKRLFRDSPEVGACILPGARNKNTYDTKFTSGMLLSLSWPAVTQLSGKPIPLVALTDYDRMPEDVDGEGSPFGLAKGRTLTFRRHGKTLCESSPGFVCDNPRWIPETKHQAPPTKGILALYNQGDRRRYYWPCVSCGNWFIPSFSLVTYPETNDFLDAAEQAVMHCPHCDAVITHGGDRKNGIPGKDQLNRLAVWLKDGQSITQDGEIVGQGVRSKTKSFWLPGVCAHFSSWTKLVLNYLNARQEYEQTGSEQALKTTVNIDQGDAYVPIANRTDRLPDELMGRALDLGQRVVPHGVRFLVTTVDVQKHRFEVQVTGVGEKGEFWIVDRYSIAKSKRIDPETKLVHRLHPGAYAEDWELLRPVIEGAYPLADGSGRQMEVKATFCDSGGEDGVTARAYDFWRSLRDDKDSDLHRRFTLVKGAPSKDAPRVQKSFPDSERKDRRASARGEVPVLMINSNMIKDQAAAMLDRRDAEGARVNFPNWLPATFYEELCVEIRTAKGWENIKSRRNESWDLLCYAIAGSIAAPIAVEQIDWTHPPGWATGWTTNIMIRKTPDIPVFKQVSQDLPTMSLEDLGRELG